jgi:alpha-ketoglutarate-dependent taurine dioxygenase
MIWINALFSTGRGAADLIVSILKAAVWRSRLTLQLRTLRQSAGQVSMAPPEEPPNATAMAAVEAVFLEHGVATERLRPHFGLAFAPGSIDLLSDPSALPPQLDQALSDAFACFGLLVFRGIRDLEPRDEMAFCKRFSFDPAQNLEVDRNYGAQIVPGQPKLPQFPAIGLVGGAHVGPEGHYGFVGEVDANDQPPGGMLRSWHCDGVIDEDPPPECTAMRSIRLPRSGGGATLFASSTRAAALAMEAAASEPDEWRGVPSLAHAMCHYRPQPSLWYEWRKKKSRSVFLRSCAQTRDEKHQCSPDRLRTNVIKPDTSSVTPGASWKSHPLGSLSSR